MRDLIKRDWRLFFAFIFLGMCVAAFFNNATLAMFIGIGIGLTAIVLVSRGKAAVRANLWTRELINILSLPISSSRIHSLGARYGGSCEHRPANL